MLRHTIEVQIGKAKNGDAWPLISLLVHKMFDNTHLIKDE